MQARRVQRGAASRSNGILGRDAFENAHPAALRRLGARIQRIHQRCGVFGDEDVGVGGERVGLALALLGAEAGISSVVVTMVVAGEQVAGGVGLVEWGGAERRREVCERGVRG
jgi:hypothetical protein